METSHSKEELEQLQELINPDPEERAEMAGLHYVNDGESGYQRKPWGRGFTYLTMEGERVQDSDLRQRFESLAIPPAWQEVWICSDEQGHIQATGRDEKGRKQYIYHPAWEETRTDTKFHRMIAFGEMLPAIRQQVDEDLRKRKLSRAKVVALVVKLLEETLIRIGNREYARNNDSYGLTTLLSEHLEISGSQLVFEFRGKSGKQQEISIRDRRLARLAKQIQELPGQFLFQYVDEEGQCCQTITSGDVNQYLRQVTGMDLTAKDFRTWGGTVSGAVELYQIGPGGSQTDSQKRVVAAVKRVAEILGNTPAVCRQYYIHPAIIAAYLDGSLFPIMQNELEQEPQGSFELGPEERAVVHILRERLNGRMVNSG